jgi:hypothetical protein
MMKQEFHGEAAAAPNFDVRVLMSPACHLCILLHPQLCLFLLHWAACGFWYIALQEGKHEMTWVGQEAAIIQGKNTFDL